MVGESSLVRYYNKNLREASHWLSKGRAFQVEGTACTENQHGPDWYVPVVWVLLHRLEGYQFDSWSGHMPGLQVRSLEDFIYFIFR